ncbi:hypothetical protein LINPERPRIM_LOCUS23623 [Linum perenne]
MIMRRWEKGVQPLDFSPKATPEWVEFQGVPPELITVEAVNWMSSRLGKPLNRFVRDGTNVRVCILRDRAVPCPEELKINNKGDIATIIVQQHKPRVYKKAGFKNEWRKVQVNSAKTADAEIVDDKGAEAVEIVDDEGAEVVVVQDTPKNSSIPATPKGLQILVEDIQDTPKTVGSEEASTSNSKKAKKKKKKKAKSVVFSDEAGKSSSQSISKPGPTPHSGNEVASSKEGTTSPASEGPVQVAGGGVGNAIEASMQVEKAPIPHAKSMSPEDKPEDGHLTDITEDEVEFHGSRKATFGDFLPFSKPAGKQKYAASGVKTRFKTKYR